MRSGTGNRSDRGPRDVRSGSVAASATGGVKSRSAILDSRIVKDPSPRPRILASWQAHTIDTPRTPPAPFTSTTNASTATCAGTMLPPFSRGMIGRRIPSSPDSRRLRKRSAFAKRPSTVARSRQSRGMSRRDASSRLQEEPCPLNLPVKHSKRPLCKESRVWEIHYDPCRFG
jgi:hypothetical protein